MYERTYHKTVLKTEEKAPKKSTSRINWKMILILTALIAVFGGMIYVIRLPKLQVKTVEVTGEHVVDPGDITEFITTQLQGNKLFILPRSSIFLVPEHTIEKALQRQFPRLQTVVVSRKNFSTLTVTVSEYQGVYLWCTTDTECYFMDQNGVTFSPAPYFSGSAYPKLFIGTLEQLPFQALSPAQLTTVQLLLERLPSIGIAPLAFHFVNDHEVTIDFNHNGQQAMVLLDPNIDPAQTITTLFTALRTNPLATKFHDPTQILQYIDLRFSNRVVYKFQ